MNDYQVTLESGDMRTVVASSRSHVYDVLQSEGIGRMDIGNIRLVGRNTSESLGVDEPMIMMSEADALMAFAEQEMQFERAA